MSLHCFECDEAAEDHHSMMTTDIGFDPWDTAKYAWRTADSWGMNPAAKLARDMKSVASTVVVGACTVGLGAVATAGAVAGSAFHAFTPAAPKSSIDRLIDALSRLGEESASERLMRQMNMAYKGVLGILIARTLYILHNVGAAGMRDAFVDSSDTSGGEDPSDRNITMQTLYKDHQNDFMTYYKPNGANENTVLTTSGWSLGSIPRGIVNIMLGVAVYVTHIVGVEGDSGDTAVMIDKVLKILCYEEVLCRLLKLHGYGALSQASYAITWIMHVGETPWYAKGKVGSGISKGVANVHQIVRDRLT